MDGLWLASAPRLVPDPLALITPGGRKLLGFDLPIGLPIHYATRAGIGDFIHALPQFGRGDWASFYLRAATPDEISLQRPSAEAAAGARPPNDLPAPRCTGEPGPPPPVQ